MTPDLKRLQQAIRDLHGLPSRYVRSENITETFEGKLVWEGAVEVFSVRGHPRASFAYAWSFENDSGNREYVAVLGVPPVNSPLDAVRAAVVAEHVRRKG